MEKKYICIKCRTKFAEWGEKEGKLRDKIFVVCPKCENNDKGKIMGLMNGLLIPLKFLPDF